VSHSFLLPFSVANHHANLDQRWDQAEDQQYKKDSNPREIACFRRTLFGSIGSAAGLEFLPNEAFPIPGAQNISSAVFLIGVHAFVDDT